jgi:hypothetical protein
MAKQKQTAMPNARKALKARQERSAQQQRIGPGSNPGNTWRCKALGHFGGKVLFCHHLRPEQRRRPSKKVLPWL